MIIGFGFLVSTSSYQVTYQSVHQQLIQYYISGDSSNGYTSYMQLVGSQALFVLHEHDFKPYIQAKDFPSGLISLIYRNDYTTSIDITSQSGIRLQGNAFIAISVTDPDTGKIYSTDIFQQNPNGFYINRWPIAWTIIVLGLLVFLAALFIGEWILRVVGSMFGAAFATFVASYLIGVFSGIITSGWRLGQQSELIGIIILSIVGLIVGFLLSIGKAWQSYHDSLTLRHDPAHIKAESEARAILLRKPQTAEDWRNRGNALDILQRFNQALAAYDRVLKLLPANHPARWVLWLDKAIVLNHAQRYRQALIACERALSMQPSSIDAIRCRGDILLGLGRNADALVMYDRILTIFPTDLGALINKSAALGRMGRREEGLVICEQALKVDPNNPIALKNRNAMLSKASESGDGEWEFDFDIDLSSLFGG
jgi:hypothetical protein